MKGNMLVGEDPLLLNKETARVDKLKLIPAMVEASARTREENLSLPYASGRGLRLCAAPWP